MTMPTEIDISGIRTDLDLPDVGGVICGSYLPLILEENGTLVDGYHRLVALLNAGVETATVIIATEEEEAARSGMAEEEWFQYLWDRHPGRGVA